MTPNNILLDIKNLTVVFPDQNPAVNGLSLEIKQGSFVSIVGESGSGKTVTALSVCRLVSGAQTSGEIIYRPGTAEAVNLLALPEEDLLKIRGAGISYVFQDPGSSLNPVLKVGKQIIESFCAHQRGNTSEAQVKALELMRSVGIPDAERIYASFPHELSGGLRQRAMIAAALMTDPKLLIADEPTTALDSVTQRGILKLLSDVQKERGLTVLFITHDLSLAKKNSDTIYVMENGKRATEAYAQKLFKAQLEQATPKHRIEI